MTYDFFRPYIFVEHFAMYSYFSQFEYDFLCDILGRVFDKEATFAEPRGEVEERGQKLAVHLAATAPFAAEARKLAPRIVQGGRRIFLLEQLCLLLALSKPEFFEDIVRPEGLEEFREMLREGGACILVTPHFGPHFVLTLILAKLGIHASAGGGIKAEFSAGGERVAQFHGIELQHSPGFVFSDDFRIRCAQLIEQGTSLLLYPEYSRSTRKGNLLVDFLGSEVHAPTGIARLAQHAGRKLSTVVLKPRAPFRYTLSLGPTFEPPAMGDEAAVEATIRAVFRQVESLVVAQPHAWLGWEFFGTMKDNAAEVRARRQTGASLDASHGS